MSFPWRTLLVASLSINLLIVGAGVGFVAAGARLRPPVLNQQVQRQPFLRALPPEDRTMLVQELEKAWGAGQDRRQAAVAARRALVEAAQKEPYDEAAVRKALAALRDADGAVMAGYHDALATALGKLPANQRAEALRAVGRAGQFGQGMRGPGPLRQQMRERMGVPPGPPRPDQPPR
jgi:uncharacterized membrane protein